MRKEFRARIEVVEEALKVLGYRRCGHPSGYYRTDWRKGRNHVKINERKPGSIVIHMHRDPRFHLGRSRTKGKDLEVEFKQIIRHTKNQRRILA